MCFRFARDRIVLTNHWHCWIRKIPKRIQLFATIVNCARQGLLHGFLALARYRLSDTTKLHGLWICVYMGSLKSVLWASFGTIWVDMDRSISYIFTKHAKCCRGVYSIHTLSLTWAELLIMSAARLARNSSSFDWKRTKCLKHMPQQPVSLVARAMS